MKALLNRRNLRFPLLVPGSVPLVALVPDEKGFKIRSQSHKGVQPGFGFFNLLWKSKAPFLQSFTLFLKA